MPSYRYEGMDEEGNEIKGVLEAESEADATSTLRSQGYFVTRLKNISDTTTKVGGIRPGNSESEKTERPKAGCSVVLLVLAITSAAICLRLQV